MSGIIETIIEAHKPLTHGRVLCFCGREFGTDALHREHVTKFLEDGLSKRIKYLESVVSQLMTFADEGITKGHINTAIIPVGTLYRIIAESYEATYRKTK